MSPLFNFSTGNPNNLVGGLSANMADIQGSLTDLKTFLNGNIDGVNAPTLETAFSSWKPWQHLGGSWSGGGGNATFLLTQNTISAPPGNGTASSAMAAIWFDPTDRTAGTRTTKLRIRTKIFAGSTSPNLTSVTTAMYPVTLTAGATVTAAIGTVVPSSAFASGNVVASSAISNDQEFNAPAAGWYAFTATMVTLAASSWMGVTLDVDYRQV